MQVSDLAARQQSAFDFLFANQNQDGGWSYKAKGLSYTEPTAMAILALLSPVGAGRADNKVRTDLVQVVKAGLDWLRMGWHEDGGWGIFHEDSFSNWNTYLGAWVWGVILKTPLLVSRFAQPEDENRLKHTRDFILVNMREPLVGADQGKQIKNLFSINYNFQGFSWGPHEAGWVIPTSLALIALTVFDQTASTTNPIVQNARSYLSDRSCPVGGWNVGNPFMFDKQLPPTPDATAYALLAWSATGTAADFYRADTTNAAVAKLTVFLTASKSDLTIALTTWALRLWQDDPNQFDTLAKQQSKLGGWGESSFVTAFGALALSSSRYYFKPGS